MITIPEGYTIPEGIKDGDEFEEVVLFRVSGGELEPIKLAGIDIAAKEEMSDEMPEDAMIEGADSMSGIAKRVMS